MFFTLDVTIESWSIKKLFCFFKSMLKISQHKNLRSMFLRNQLFVFFLVFSYDFQ
jgi:hypothetical protein